MEKFKCKDCKIPKTLRSFHYTKAGKPTRYVCKKCWNKRIRKHSKKNYPKRREYLRNYSLFKKFKLTPEQYEQMLLDQSGSCKIPPYRARLGWQWIIVIAPEEYGDYFVTVATMA